MALALLPGTGTGAGTGAGAGPDLLEIMDMLGAAEISSRIALAINNLSDRVK